MLWNHTQDEPIYYLSRTLGDIDAQPVTRRLILSTATRFFDPLGLISPVILPLRSCFRSYARPRDTGTSWLILNSMNSGF